VAEGAAVAHGSTASEPPQPRGLNRQRLADGIYGTIITASVLISAGDELATVPLALSVIVTLAVYWLADVYAHLLAGPLEHGRLPSWPDARHALARRWPLVSASFSPLILLIVAWLLGAPSSVAATVGLVAAIVMLVIYSYSAGRAAQLRTHQLTVLTVVAALIGVVMIVLKNVVLVHLH